MGNYVSACQIPLQNADATAGAGSRVYSVLVPSEGRVAEVEVPPGCPCLKVSKLLLEFPPGHFLARFQKADFDIHLLQQPIMTSLNPRAYPMPADSDAQPHEQFVYALLPMPRLHTRITQQELLALTKLLHTHALACRHPLNTASECSLNTSKRQLVQSASKLYAALFSVSTKVTPIVEEIAPPPQGSIVNEQWDRSPDKQFVNAGTQEIPMTLPLISPYHGDPQQELHAIRPKPWAPKLDTIDETA